LKKQLDAVLLSILSGLPGVGTGTKFNSTNFTIGDKVFAFTREDGIVLKLPSETVKELIETRSATALVMGKRTMKEWVVIHYDDPEAAGNDLQLFTQAIDFVSSKS